MKTTKLILAIAFFAFSTMAFAQKASLDSNDPVPGIRCVKISLENVPTVRGLTAALHQQISKNILIFYQANYTVRVYYRHNVYYITASYAEWKEFFKMALNDDPPER